MKIISYIIAIILILFGLSFALLNASPVKLNYYLGSTHVSLSLLLILTVGVGILIGFLASIGSIFRLKHKNYRLKNRVKELEKDIISTSSDSQ